MPMKNSCWSCGPPVARYPGGLPISAIGGPLRDPPLPVGEGRGVPFSGDGLGGLLGPAVVRQLTALTFPPAARHDGAQTPVRRRRQAAVDGEVGGAGAAVGVEDGDELRAGGNGEFHAEA